MSGAGGPWRPLADGEDIVFVDTKFRRYLTKIRAGQTFQYHKGVVPFDEIIGRDEGAVVHSSRGQALVAFRPTLGEFVLEMKRATQIIYPKDLAYILFQADVFPGARVLESGVGSGSLTMALLRAVGPTGRVITYEQREELVDRARANVNRYLGSSENLEVRIGDIYEPISEAGFDRAVLDVPEPWQALPTITTALRPGGILLTYSPTIIQSEQTVSALRATGRYALVDTTELLIRPWHIRGTSVRPVHRMIAHTAFITTARLMSEAAPEFLERAVADDDDLAAN